MESDRHALILGLGHPRQDPFLRSLHKAGIRVHAAYNRRKAKEHSRYLASFLHLPEDPDGQIRMIEEFGKRHGGFLVATNDDYVGLVAKNRERLSRYFTVPLPGWDIVGPMLERERAFAVAEPLGIAVPKTWRVETEAELEARVAALDVDNFDYILKTHSVLSQPIDRTGARQSRPAPRDRATILELSRQIRERTGAFPLIQEVVPGHADAAIGVTLVIGPDGREHIAYCVQRLRLSTYKLAGRYVHPYIIGSVVWCQTVHDEEALEKTRALVDAFGYTGIVTVEFRRHPTTGELYLMKVEPRPVRATGLASRIGMDIPTTLHAAFNNQPVNLPDDYPDGVQWLWIRPYLRSFFTNETRNRKDLLRLVGELRHIRSFGEDLSDPLPLVIGTAKLASHSVRSMWERSR